MRIVLSERQGGIALDRFPALCLVAAVGVDTFMGAWNCFGNANDHVCHVTCIFLLQLRIICLLMQVLEETGFDVGSRLRGNDYIEIHMQEKRSRLYIIQGVSTPACLLSRFRQPVLEWQTVSVQMDFASVPAYV